MQVRKIKHLTTLILTLIIPANAWAELINKTCVTDSGLSIYDISLNTESNSWGEIRFRYLEQDIFYSASIKIEEGSKLIGIAEFKENRKTGYPEGVSWIFTYDTKKQTLKDNDSVEAKCK
jgi:hypothetical protein